MGWDAALDRAMEQHIMKQEQDAERIQELLETEEHDPCKPRNFFEAMSDSSFSDEENQKFEALLRSKDVKALDMLLELSTNYQLHFIEEELDDE